MVQRSHKFNLNTSKPEYEIGDKVWVVRPEMWHVYSKPTTKEVKYKAQENWIGPYHIRSNCKNKSQVFEIEFDEGVLLTHKPLNGRKATNFHVRYLRPCTCDQDRPKELPELFVVESEDEFEDDQEISEESILRN